ncbi:MAG: DNA-binding protein [Gammaproteobacteria bacterium]|nr:DNA-binding protein [Gammaproteobacteria bacterium]
MNTHLETSIAIVDSASGHKIIDRKTPFILALKIGENLFEAILRCADDANLQSATISGLGALDDVTVAYYNLQTKQYQTKLFKGMYELISLNGNITWVEGKRFIHIHAALGGEDYQVIGGHIMEATVGPSAEISIVPLAAGIHREYDAETGLKLMCPFHQ